jgi:hypothetical protein
MLLFRTFGDVHAGHCRILIIRRAVKGRCRVPRLIRPVGEVLKSFDQVHICAITG